MTNSVHLIGIAGPAGAGKDLISDIICRMYGAENLSTGDFVRAVTRHVYRLPHEFSPVRDQLYEVANFMRTRVDPAITVKMCILQAEVLGIKIALVTGLRSMGEADAIRAAGGIVLAVDANPRIRYERIHNRKRDAESKRTFEEFLEQDAYENKGLSETGAGRGIRAIVDTADVSIANNGSFETIEQEIKAKLDPYLT